jgi:hypothetical protein
MSATSCYRTGVHVRGSQTEALCNKKLFQRPSPSELLPFSLNQNPSYDDCEDSLFLNDLPTL